MTMNHDMTTRRIHTFGASGAGVTTLGRALADALAAPHHDTDDYYWHPTAPPYRDKRDVADRLRLMREIFLDRPDWVLSGSLDDWGGAVVPLFDLVVFVRVPTEVRLQRLRDREARRFGLAETSPGGWRHKETEEFIEWASHYDDGTREGRHLSRHLKWLDSLTCPVRRVDGTRPIPDLVDEIIAAFSVR
jgi:adenylate kinase family enzyme